MTTQSLSSDVALRQLPARGERMNHNYALGYHEAWECALHRWRESQLSSGKNPTLKEETVWLEDWLTRNRKIAAETKLCPVCSVQIAEAVSKGLDPFACPDFARRAIEEFGLKLRGRR